nr:MAG TPA: hypothetical protein [Caudoviricetes sp.]
MFTCSMTMRDLMCLSMHKDGTALECSTSYARKHMPLMVITMNGEKKPVLPR